MNRQDKLQDQLRKLSLARRQREKRESEEKESEVRNSQVKEYVEEALKNGINGTECSDLR